MLCYFLFLVLNYSSDDMKKMNVIIQSLNFESPAAYQKVIWSAILKPILSVAQLKGPESVLDTKQNKTMGMFTSQR